MSDIATGRPVDDASWRALLCLMRDGHSMGPFARGLGCLTLRAIAEKRDFTADLDTFLGDYRLGMIAAGIDPGRASTTLAELRDLVLEEWHAGRAAAQAGA